MRPPPSLARIPQFPVITVISAAAIFVTLAVKAGRTDIDPFVMSSLTFEGQPWRLASSALPHADFMHIFFNLYWLWILGTRIEEELGHVTTLLLIIVLAVGSAAAQYAFSVGGIGLSGVGYGFVGFLAVAAKLDSRFRDALDRRTLVMFGVWFVLCVVLTVSGTWSIGNYAHGGGFLLGVPLALVIARGPLARRALGVLATVILLAGFLAAASLWRDRLNLSDEAGYDDERLALHEIDAKQYDDAVRHLEHALVLSPGDGRIWYNYGVALQNASSPKGTTKLDAWKRALALTPKDDLARDAVSGELFHQALVADKSGDPVTAERLYRESLTVKPSAEAAWNLGLIMDKSGKADEATKLFDQARKLDPKIDADGSGSD